MGSLRGMTGPVVRRQALRALGCLGAWAVGILAAAPAADVGRQPAPGWVRPLAIPEISAEAEKQTSDGVALLLLDRQRNEREQVSFDHVARKLTSSSGVQEGSRISIEFAPDYQKLTLHQLTLHRGSETIDRLPTAHVRLLDREEGWRDHVYNGIVTAAVDVEGVRPGDILEYSFSIAGENPVFAGVYGEFVQTSWDVPLARFQYRLLWPGDRYLGFQQRGPKLAHVATEDGDFAEHRWSAENLPAARAEGDNPSWFSPYGWLQVSGYRNWREVVDWALDFYSRDDSLPPEVQDEIDRLSQLTWEDDRIVGALEYVQNKFRYLSVSEGVHSHRPYPIAAVVARGFGDCKDKARLLAAMLRKLGFEAEPALVHTDYRQEIAGWLPSPLDFNHAIVALRRDDRRYWLDPTRDHQRGRLSQRYGPAYGKALIIQAGETALSDVQPSAFGLASISEETTFRLPANADPPEMKVRTTYYGREADRERYFFASASREQVARDYLNFTSRQYPDSESLGAPKVRDDERENVVTVEEAYRLPKFWQTRKEVPSGFAGEIYPFLIDNETKLPSTPVRSSPLAVGHPRILRQSFVLNLPVGGTFSDENVAIDDPAFQFSMTVRYANQRLIVVYEYRSRAASVPAERVSEYLARVRQVREHLGYSVTIPRHVVDGESAGSEGAFTPNWLLVVVVAFFALFGLAAAALVYRWRPSWPPRPVHPKYAGLRGWLLLVAVGLFVRPGTAIASLFQLGYLFSLQSWQELTLPGRANYHPLWAPMILAELFFLITVLALSLALLVIFFQRRRTFPPLFVALLGAVAIFTFFDQVGLTYLARALPALKSETNVKDVVQTAMQAMIWIPYMLCSKRVRATFVK